MIYTYWERDKQISIYKTHTHTHTHTTTTTAYFPTYLSTYLPRERERKREREKERKRERQRDRDRYRLKGWWWIVVTSYQRKYHKTFTILLYVLLGQNSDTICTIPYLGVQFCHNVI